MTMTQQQAQDQPVRETTVERVDEQPTPRRTLQVEALEARVTPSVVPPNPVWGN
jgi:hypothetical protein